MGLFMKEDEYPGLFKNRGRLINNNQTDFRSDYLSDIIKDQQTSNELIQRAIQALKNTQNRSNQQQIMEWKTVHKQLHELKELHTKHEQIEKQVMDWLEKLEARHAALQTTMTDEQLGIKNLINQMNDIGQSQTEFDLQLKQMSGANEEIAKRLSQYNTANNKIAKQLNHYNVINDELVNRLNHTNALNDKILHSFNQYNVINDEIAQRLNQYEKTNDEMVNQLTQIETKNDSLLDKVDAQHTLQQTMTDQITNMEEKQNVLATRLENHEGLMEKVLRQLDHLRSILYERTNFLNGKIEKASEHFNKTFTKN